MNSLTVTTPIRVASLPKSYLHLTVRSYANAAAVAGLRGTPSLATRHRQQVANKRFISSTPQTKKDSSVPALHSDIKSAWTHPVYNDEQIKQVTVAHRDAKDWADWVALGTVRVLRWGMDLVTGYRHPPKGRENEAKFRMTEKKWLTRFVFLESVAGVPGMVGGMLRHLRSLRRMKRDNGWIETLLEEAYNERMHLLTFLKLAEPGLFMRLMVLGAQGVFFNGFFLSYLISPRICHRFVGYLEEEAVITYTRAIEEIEAGKLPEWEKVEAPDMAVRYWKMPENQQTMKDLLLYIRADEAKHREVNHTLGNLNQTVDPNPYTAKIKDPAKACVSKGIENLRSTGWERHEVL
ncbi:hypothetical protein ASPWEDRAFT_187989 [Aspergillus wentii DTO 134E9]|uniref:Alternative oxidase n=1 Tax=Aspergillus wentii DTO 134E9 TaxID=1073089 RepID=A0A1L9R6R7_ASPWE|nr:uncharacterized protein ASPWEDRAFT_187989 [Aspergillus wentii DTO 134E9]KAI9926726.1 Alternative oxidase, mitochondrial precursor [Aspergillus wentii]OJJ30611.1 hypothetical protein ASPWEDRAFT_187989 [Aspergillus wentii DTO 134E9]WQY90906.1 mitochondrial alternative oxidase [Aspergillus wentii]